MLLSNFELFPTVTNFTAIITFCTATEKNRLGWNIVTVDKIEFLRNCSRSSTTTNITVCAVSHDHLLDFDAHWDFAVLREITTTLSSNMCKLQLADCNGAATATLWCRNAPCSTSLIFFYHVLDRLWCEDLCHCPTLTRIRKPKIKSIHWIQHDATMNSHVIVCNHTTLALFSYWMLLFQTQISPIWPGRVWIQATTKTDFRPNESVCPDMDFCQNLCPFSL